jgi:imidazolonepropionase-like amidohydrolase
VTEQAGRPHAIVGGRLLDGLGGPPIDDSCVLVQGGRIVAAGTRGNVGVTDGAEVLDATGRTVLPGLMDLHVHSQSTSNLRLYIQNGVTSIRYAGGFQQDILALRARVECGEIVGPRIFSCGPILDMPPVAHPGHTEGVRDPDHARQVVERLIGEERVDALIVTQRITPATMAAIIERAHAFGVPVTGQNWLVCAREAVEIGIDGLENTARLPESSAISDAEIVAYPSVPARLATLVRLWASADDDRLDALAALMAERDVTLCPGLVGYEAWAGLAESDVTDDADVRQGGHATDLVDRADFLARVAGSWSDRECFEIAPAAIVRFKQFIRQYRDLGGRVVAGTDLPLGGVSLHRELGHLKDAVLSTADVLAAATREAGRAIRAPMLGTLVPGAPADLLVVDGDPLSDLHVLRHPRGVLVAGRWLVRDGALLEPSAVEG